MDDFKCNPKCSDTSQFGRLQKWYQKDGKYFCEIYDNCFFHYRAGGNWMEHGFKLHNDLSLKLKDILVDK